jgi:hypothetical protein
MGGVMRVMLVSFLMISMTAGCISQENMKNEDQVTHPQTPPGDDAVIKEKIRSNLIGTEIVYYDIRGKPVTYNVTEKDIKSIEKTVLEGRTVWKVRIGEKLAWDYYYEEYGNKIIKKEQLFVT